MYGFHRQSFGPALSLFLTGIAVLGRLAEREKKEKWELVPLHVTPRSVRKGRVTVSFNDSQRIKSSSYSDNRHTCTARRCMYV